MLFKSAYSIPIPDQDILSWLFDKPAYDLRKPVFVDAANPKSFLTGADLRSLAQRYARGLRDLAGVRSGDRVLVFSPNTVLYPALYFGIIAADCIFTGANPAYGKLELTHQLSNSGAKAIFASPELFPLARKCASEVGIPSQNVFLFVDRHVSGVRTLADLRSRGELPWRRCTDLASLASTVVALNYSSGTTGPPKGCMTSHRNVVSHSEQMLALRDIGNERLQHAGQTPCKEVFLCFLPMYHGFGQQHHLIRSAKTGDTCYVMPKFDFELYLQYIQRFRISSLSFVPPVAVLLAKSPLTRKYDLSSVQHVIAGAAPLGEQLAREAELAIDPSGRVRIRQAWGQTECTMAVTWWTMDDPCSSGVGKLCPNVEARVVKPDGRAVGFGERGEFLIRGPNVFMGYWRNDAATASTLAPGGWLRTGDVGFVEPNGVFYIVDRAKELIKVNGYQVAPAELEDLLLKSPDVADAAVVGVPRGEHGEECPRAYVVRAHPRVQAAAVSAWVAERLAPYKRLTGGVVFLDAIPKSPSGKILRRELREQAKAEFGRERAADPDVIRAQPKRRAPLVDERARL